MKEQRAPADTPQAALGLVFWIAAAVLLTFRHLGGDDAFTQEGRHQDRPLQNLQPVGRIST
jgi:hypothetical protein